MICCTICDNNEVNTETIDFKNRIADAVRDLVIQEWDKISNVKKYEKINNGQKEYYVDIILWEK